MYVVAGVTGNTGSVAAGLLLARGHAVRVLLHRETHADAWRRRGAEVAIVALDDAAALARAFAGASGAHVLIPPAYGASDMLAVQRAIGDAIAEAVGASGIPHVVLLSSLGAQHAEGNGPIRSLHYAEAAIGKVARKLTVVRAAYFLENWAAVLGEARANGVLYSFLTPGRAIPMVATRDIGRAAAEALLDPAPGSRLVELFGPQDWTPEDIARDIAGELGREVRVQGLPLEAVVPTFTAQGMANGVPQLFRELIEGLNRGHVAEEGGRAIARFGTLRPGEVLGPLLTPPRA
jgi:uncharacterized protein YbjT (DUF2867 family)